MTAKTPKAETTINDIIPKRDTEGMHAMKIKALTLAVAAGLHILGWLLAITVIAAITRLFSRS